jgi:hypothetical protein
LAATLLARIAPQTIARDKNSKSKTNGNDSGLNFEAQLWAAAGKMRGHLAIRGIDANLGPRNADSFRTDLQAADVENNGERFEQKMKRLVAALQGQQIQAAKLDGAITENLKELGYCSARQRTVCVRNPWPSGTWHGRGS